MLKRVWVLAFFFAALAQANPVALLRLRVERSLGSGKKIFQTIAFAGTRVEFEKKGEFFCVTSGELADGRYATKSVDVWGVEVGMLTEYAKRLKGEHPDFPALHAGAAAPVKPHAIRFYLGDREVAPDDDAASWIRSAFSKACGFSGWKK